MLIETRGGRRLRLGDAYRFRALPGSDHQWMDDRACRLLASASSVDDKREWLIVEFLGMTEAEKASIRHLEEFPRWTWPAADFQLEFLQ